MSPFDTLRPYLDDLASAKPAPGGGAAAALTAAQGAALLSMVGNLTIGKAKFVEFDGELREILAATEAARGAMLQQADADVAAFSAVMAAYGLPKATEDESRNRSVRIQAALKASSEVPFALFKLCLPLLPLADRLEAIGNPAVLSDVIVGRHLLRAGLLSAVANVEANLGSIKDAEFCREKREFIAAESQRRK